MKSNMRAALGLGNRGHLALESEEPEVVESDKLNVVMKGPLAAVYTDALDIAYSKELSDPTAQEEPAAETGVNVDPEAEEKSAEAPNVDPEATVEATDEPVEAGTAAAVTAVVLESMANDAAAMQTLHDGMVEEVPAEATEFMTLYAVDQSEVAPADVINVTELLKDTDQPENVVVLIDSVVPPNAEEEPSAEEKAAADGMVTALESIVTSMGGKVVRNFADAVALTAKKK
jgi:hypothetical protein